MTDPENPMLANEVVDDLKVALQKFYNKDREGIHVSDLVNCIRKQAFRKLDKYPQPLTDAELNNFSSGRGIHGATESLLQFFPDKYETEKEVYHEFGDIKIVAHIDMYGKNRNLPFELKTYRVSPHNIPTHTPPSSQWDQLRFYMAMTKSNHGVLLGQYINEFNKSPFVPRYLHMTDMQLEEQLIELERRALALKRALDAGDPSLAPHVWNDEEKRKYMCKNCPYQIPCEQMRIKEFMSKLPK